MPALRLLAAGGETPKVDIVAIHGLNPKGRDVKQHAWDTWRKPAGEGGNLWLRDLLPKALPKASIFLYEYDSRIFSDKHDTFLDAGNELLDCLRAKRREDPRRPLVLVGHSLGGLLIKQALVNAHDNSHYSDIELSVKGLVFFGTPHEGGNQASAKVRLGFTAAAIAKSLGFNSNDSIVQALTPGSAFGGFLRESFRHQLDKYLIVSFWEKKSTIVTKESATFGLPGHRESIFGLEADHRNICKFDPAVEANMDVYEIVRGNFVWIYDEILNTRSTVWSNSMGHHQQRDRALSQYINTASWKLSKLQSLRQEPPDIPDSESLSWMLNELAYYNWNEPSQKKKGLWCSVDQAERFLMPTWRYLQEECGHAVIFFGHNPQPTDHPMIPRSNANPGLTAEAEATLISCLLVLLQLCVSNGYDISFMSFATQNGIFIPHDNEGLSAAIRRIADACVQLIACRNDLQWTLLVEDTNLLGSSGLLPAAWPFLERIYNLTKSLENPTLRVLLYGEMIHKGGNFVTQFYRILAPSIFNVSITQYIDCVNSLTLNDFDKRRERIVKATIGTNHWIWDDPAFLAFKTRTSAALWISGKPGSGKSVLARTIQEYLSVEDAGDRGPRTTVVASWFYSRRDNLVDHRQMFTAILYQLLAHDKSLSLFNVVRPIYLRRFPRLPGLETPWNMQELRDALQAIFSGADSLARAGIKRVIILLDGLDESQSRDVELCSRADALKFLVQLTKADTPLQIITLSRPFEDIQKAFRDAYFISMHDVNRSDIDILIRQGIQDLSRRLDGYNSDDPESESDDGYVDGFLFHPGRKRGITSTQDSHEEEVETNFDRASNPSHLGPSYFSRAEREKRAILAKIETYLKVNARGVVLWITTVLHFLRKRCREEPFCDISTLEAELYRLPLELNELYVQIVDDLLASFNGNPRTLQTCRRALMWVSSSAKYRFHLQDLLEVIATDLTSEDTADQTRIFSGFQSWSSFKRQIQRLCGPFIQVVPLPRRISEQSTKEPKPTQWDILQLAHETVRTFLQDPAAREIRFSAAEAEAVVSTERGRYLRQTLPALKPLLPLSTRAILPGSLGEAIYFMGEHPLLSFLLTSGDFDQTLNRICFTPPPPPSITPTRPSAEFAPTSAATAGFILGLLTKHQALLLLKLVALQNEPGTVLLLSSRPSGRAAWIGSVLDSGGWPATAYDKSLLMEIVGGRVTRLRKGKRGGKSVFDGVKAAARTGLPRAEKGGTTNRAAGRGGNGPGSEVET